MSELRLLIVLELIAGRQGPARFAANVRPTDHARPQTGQDAAQSRYTGRLPPSRSSRRVGGLLACGVLITLGENKWCAPPL